MKIGILIIGSLWWRMDDREKWRAARLAVDRAVQVKVPIHYGRKSKSHTYTMTFASAGDGVALVVPCRNEGDTTVLFKEAEELWGAEINGSAKSKNISKDWGCVGARFRIDMSPHEVAAWSRYFRSCGGKALAAVDEGGLLQIPWAERIDGQPLDCDVLLATANVETIPATPEDIAVAWIERGQEEYFFENVRAGIRTPDDERIWRRMVTALDWVKQQTVKYGPTIEGLRNQYDALPDSSRHDTACNGAPCRSPSV